MKCVHHVLLEFAKKNSDKNFRLKRSSDWLLETYQSTFVDELRLLKSFLLFQLFFFLWIEIDDFDSLLIDQSTLFNLKFFISLKFCSEKYYVCFHKILWFLGGFSRGPYPHPLANPEKLIRFFPKFYLVVFQVLSQTDIWKIHPESGFETMNFLDIGLAHDRAIEI